MKTISVCAIHGDYDDHVHPMCPTCRDTMYERDPLPIYDDEPRPATAYDIEQALREVYKEHGAMPGRAYIRESSRLSLNLALAPRITLDFKNPPPPDHRITKLQFRWGTLDIESRPWVSPGWLVIVGSTGVLPFYLGEEGSAS